ncbi:Hypothetical_protein [Hexamita inflata]|uniref:Hypothetical_protein n=1 Tax=Hexamita inflata TaxID=28002 RepID=A0AA86RK33_9EUKA|nr:Hypothetical protein HINF_LOCUS63958 [Hexamita inflata]
MLSNNSKTNNLPKILSQINLLQKPNLSRQASYITLGDLNELINDESSQDSCLTNTFEVIDECTQLSIKLRTTVKFCNYLQEQVDYVEDQYKEAGQNLHRLSRNMQKLVEMM